MASFDVIEQLETQLLEKEQLIAALTMSLEQAANELDRAHRHQGRVSLFSKEEDETEEISNAELLLQIREQQALLYEIREGVRQKPAPLRVESTHPDLALSRIENQLDEIRELIETLSQAPSHPELLPADWKESLTQQMVKLRENPIADLLGLTAGTPAKADVIARVSLKAEEIPALPETQESAESEKGQERETEVETGESEFTPSEKTMQLVETLPEIPAVIDLETNDVEALRQAVEERDICIQALQDYIVALNTVSVPEFDLKDYDSLPDEQRQKLENWEAVIRENMRRTEVELSVERARIGREQQKMQFQQLQLAKERKRMGMQQQSTPSNEQQDLRKGMPRGNQSSRSWLNLFHRHEPTDEEKGESSGDSSE